jgi:tripeptide aminopeptidase
MDDAIRERAGPAVAALRAGADDWIAAMLELAAIPGPSFDEGPRGHWLAARLAPFAQTVARDDVGNVTACLPGGDASLPPILLVAHLDTVFSREETRTPIVREGVIHAPGISDNTRGVVALVALAHALARGGVRLRHRVELVGSAGEEGTGDLRGVKHLFRERDPRRAAAVIAVDGSGVARIIHRGLGARRVRITLRGPGGHSWNDRGRVNPLHAAASLASAFLGAAAPLLEDRRSAATFARTAAGTGINVIPAEAWLEVDLRSESADSLGALVQLLESCTAEAAAVRGSDGSGLSAALETFGDRPVGHTPADSPLVQAAVAATRAIGATPELTASSTDANVPMSIGIPAIALGAGGQSGGMHTVGEWYSDEEGVVGLERLLFTLLGVDGDGKAVLG